jgi:hypothetical protein
VEFASEIWYRFKHMCFFLYTPSIDPELSANFSTEELNTTLLTVKSGKTACFDGVYPTFIKNSAQRTKAWIVALFNDILTSG